MKKASGIPLYYLCGDIEENVGVLRSALRKCEVLMWDTLLQETGPSFAPCICFFVFLARSRDLRRSFGTRGTDVASIASWEALDARTSELLVRVSDLAW